MNAISSLKWQLNQTQCHLNSTELMSSLLEITKQETLNSLFKDLVSDFISNFPLDSQHARIVNQDIVLYDSSKWLMLFKPRKNPNQLVRNEIIYAPSSPFIFVNCGEIKVKFPAYELAHSGLKNFLKPINSVCVNPKDAFVFDQISIALDFFPGQLVNAIYLYDLENPVAVRSAFSLKTNQVMFSTIGEPDDSRTKALLMWLGEVGSIEPDVNVVNDIINFVSHPSHVIRWAAIQALSNIDFEKAKTFILAAQSDNHPEIAKVAYRIVNREGL